VSSTALTSTAWAAVASDRSRDAVALWAADRCLAATYLKWYAVECLAKALVVATGGKPPTGGREGHDIGAILDQANFRRNDFPAELRHHYEQRSVAMRYELEGCRSFADEYKAAAQLASRLAARARRAESSPRQAARRRG
jgi:HEPN domain-containing protein